MDEYNEDREERLEAFRQERRIQEQKDCDDAERMRWLIKGGKPAVEYLTMADPLHWREKIDRARLPPDQKGEQF